jgi:hypothetical protein
VVIVVVVLGRFSVLLKHAKPEKEIPSPTQDRWRNDVPASCAIQSYAMSRIIE